MQHKKKIQKLSITNKVNSNFVISFFYHSIGKLFCSESLNLGSNNTPYEIFIGLSTFVLSNAISKTSKTVFTK